MFRWPRGLVSDGGMSLLTRSVLRRRQFPLSNYRRATQHGNCKWKNLPSSKHHYYLGWKDLFIQEETFYYSLALRSSETFGLLRQRDIGPTDYLENISSYQQITCKLHPANIDRFTLYPSPCSFPLSSFYKNYRRKPVPQKPKILFLCCMKSIQYFLIQYSTIQKNTTQLVTLFHGKFCQSLALFRESLFPRFIYNTSC